MTGQVTVPAGGVGTFTAGNVRPAPISGVVFIDTNRNGIRDAGEVGRAGVRLDLTGTRPGGITVTARRTAVGRRRHATASPTCCPAPTRCRSRCPGGLHDHEPAQIGGHPDPLRTSAARTTTSA